MLQNGQVAVVTGGARGIGHAMAAALATDGGHVVILDNGAAIDGTKPDPAPGMAAAQSITAAGGGTAEALCVNVGQADAVTKAVRDITARHGPIDVLANAAGIVRPGPFLEDTPASWASVLSAHVGGHLSLIGAVLPGMLARGQGAIINVTSTSAILGSRRQPAYSMAKEAVIGLTRTLAPGLAAAGISMNAISPAAATRMSAGMRLPEGPERAACPDEFLDRDPAHVGRFARWLASAGAAGIAGRVFLVSGRFVIEYGDIRRWKWAEVPDHADAEKIANTIRWVIGRPHPAVIGPWPTRDPSLAQIERLWEGAALGPDLVPARPGPQPGKSASGVAVLGYTGSQQQAAVLGGLGPVRPVATLPSVDAGSSSSYRAAGSVVFADTGALACKAGPRLSVPRRAAVLAVPPADAVCGDASALLAAVQSAIRLTEHHARRSLVVVLLGWQHDFAELPAALAWYGAVGLIRGGAATEAVYGVRVNGIAVSPGHENLAAGVAQYLLSRESDWLNGCILTTDELGIGLLADEQPRWQSYTASSQFRLPAELAIAKPSAYRV